MIQLAHVRATSITMGRDEPLPDITIRALPFLSDHDKPPCIGWVAIFDEAARLTTTGMRGPDENGMNPQAYATSIRAAVTKAKEICGTCPFINGCREWSVSSGERFGIWAALSPGERSHLRQVTS